MKYEFIEHTADVQFKAYGKSLEEVFSNCAYAFVESICKEDVLKKKKIKFNVQGNDLENLLYNFLEELLFLFDSEGFILSKILKMKIDEKNLKLNCEIIGDSGDYEVYSHVKAVTYNSMFVRKEIGKKETEESGQEEGGWIAQVVLDV